MDYLPASSLPRTRSSTQPEPPLPVASTKPPVHRPFVLQGDDPTSVLALVLDDECIRRWAIVLHESCFPGELTTLSPEDAERVIYKAMLGPPRYMVGQVYREFPNFPRLERNLVLIDNDGIPGRDPDTVSWLLVLRDNSCTAAANAPIDPEELKAVKEFLGVMKQGARWYDLSHRFI